MKIDKNKLKRQELGVEKWKARRGVGGLKWITGMGKTFTSTKLIASRVIKARQGAATVRVVVPTDALRTQWKQAIIDLDPLHVDKYHVETHKWYLKQDTVFECTLLIVDEVDEFYGPQHRKVWDKTYIKWKFFAWLSYTPEVSSKAHEDLFAIAPIADYIGEVEAKENNWIHSYLTFNLGLELSEKEREEYEEYEKIIEEELEKFPSLTMMYNCLSGGKDSEGEKYPPYAWATAIAKKHGWSYDLEQAVKTDTKPATMGFETWKQAKNVISIWTPGLVIGYANRCSKAIQSRKSLVYNSSTKIETILNILEKFKDRKAITFSMSTSFTNRLAEAATNSNIKAIEYHSKIESRPLREDAMGLPSLFGVGDYIRVKSKKSKNFGEPKIFGATTLKRMAIEAIHKGLARVILTASALDKGFDVPDIELAINASGSSTDNQYLQRRGRAVRVTDSQRDVILINLYFKRTVEHNWLKKAQRNTANRPYWVNNISEIFESKKDEPKQRIISI
jgi:superfamily II DNA or RNA helicase